MVRINDCESFIGGRSIDLSHAGAKEIWLSGEKGEPGLRRAAQAQCVSIMGDEGLSSRVFL
jgi:hypothetical protein